MTAHTSPMGIEITARETEIVADYADMSGRYVQYFMPHPTDSERAFLLTAQSDEEGDAFALLLTRAEHLDGTLGSDWMHTTDFGSCPDLTDEQVAQGYTEQIVIEGRAYLGTWADDVLICSVEIPEAV